ncbi:MAG: EamA family transporter [Limnochordales bacterium]|nr:EamA family transporter [Limnochordales bacterium]
MRPGTAIAISILLGAFGQLSLKKGITVFGSVDKLSPGCIISMLTQPFVAAGLLLYAVSAVLWLVVLSRVELSTAYPMLSLGYVLVVLLSWLFFRESLSLIKVLGVLLICAGVALIGRP